MATEVSPSSTTTVTVSIPAGAALSEWFVVNGRVTGLYMPEGWDAADIYPLANHQASGAGYPIFDAGVERFIPSAQAVAGRYLALDYGDWLGVKAIRLRSGTAGAPVVQSARRDIIVAIAG